MSSAPRSLARSIAHTLGTIVLAQGAQILAGIATARAFGPAGKGIISYMGIFLGFAVASADGIRNAIAYQIGNERIAPARVWATARTLAFTLGPIGSLFFAGLYLHDRTQPAFAFVAFAFPFALYLQAVNMLYLVRHAIAKINVQNVWTVGAGSSLAIVIAIVAVHASVIAVLSITFLGYVAAALWAALGVRALLPARTDDASADRNDVRVSLVREQAAFGLKGGLSAIVTLLALRVDILIVGSTLSRVELGLYTTAIALAELLLALSRSVTWATTGRISTDDRADAIVLTARVVRSLIYGLAASALVMGLAGPWAISLFYGNRFAGSAPLLAIVLPRVVFYSADGVLAAFIAIRQGRPGVQFAYELATLVVCAASTYAALGRYGLRGAAIAATSTFVIAFFAKLAYFVHVSGVGWPAVLIPRSEDVPPRLRALLPKPRPT
jgi:O-antigen/teichoic acid export membrane protein